MELLLVQAFIHRRYRVHYLLDLGVLEAGVGFLQVFLGGGLGEVAPQLVHFAQYYLVPRPSARVLSESQSYVFLMGLKELF